MPSTTGVYFSTNYGKSFSPIKSTVGVGNSNGASVTASQDFRFITYSITSLGVYTSTLQPLYGGKSIAIGYQAGLSNQGANSIAIGAYAGQTNQSANSIVLDASSVAITAATSGFFVNPIATVSTSNPVYYTPSTKIIYNHGRWYSCFCMEWPRYFCREEL